MRYKTLVSLYDGSVKQLHPAVLTAVPVAFPELIRIRVQVLDDQQRIVQEREHTPLLPWSRIDRLPLQPGVRAQSERLLRDGMQAPLGIHLLSIDLDDGSNPGLEFA